MPPPADDPGGKSDPSEWQVWSQASVNTLRRPPLSSTRYSAWSPRLSGQTARVPNTGPCNARPWCAAVSTVRSASTRVTDALIMDLEQVKAIRRAVEGATVNDAIVAIVGGGAQIPAKQERTARHHLSPTAPINMRQGSSSTSSGNQVSNMTISMATDIADPLERLRAVNLSAKGVKGLRRGHWAPVSLWI